MTDRIALKGVSATGYHGVLGFEKRDGQTFVVDVTMRLDLSIAGRTDQLSSTVNYAEIADAVVARITGRSFDLIERLAEVIADDVLVRPEVDDVAVTVHKPQAPVGQPFTDVAVTVRRSNAPRVVIALGGNLGADPRATMLLALADLAVLPGLHLTGASRFYSTAPVGGPEDQPDYINAVTIGRYEREPEELLYEMHVIENRYGRTREVRWAARTLDLDMIQFGVPGSHHEITSEEKDLVLPHPRAHERAFVLVPWLEVDPRATLRVPRAQWDGGIAAVADLLDGMDSSQVRAL